MPTGFIRSTPATVQLTTGLSAVTSVATDTGVITTGIYNGVQLSPSYIPSISSQPTVTVAFVAGTQLTAPADGTLQVTTAGGLFGTVLFGAAGATTGMRLVASNGVLTLTDGTGTSQTPTLQLGITGSNNGVRLTNNGGGTLNITNEAGGLANVGGQINNITANGTISTASEIVANSANNVNTGLQFGSTGIRFDNSGTAGVYYVRSIGGLFGNSTLLQGVYTVAKAANYTVTGADNGTHFNVTAAATITLPTPALGLAYKITNIAATALVVTTPSGVINGFGLTGAASRNTAVAFACSDFVCNDGTNWVMRGFNGTWT